MAEIQKLTQSTFDETVASTDTPVLVDFWAEWCKPCKAMDPVLEELAAQYADKAIVAKVNVDEERGLAAQYQIMSIPALMIFKGGERVAEFNGAQPLNKLQAHLDKWV
ncbi:thioredoxin [Corynebacterium resistens DSM 45100]|uniref:Thioredoxin n=1 Tax=Corynebacterium resistens (strain DSM 45100 / JCM 12819 / GTC 2026 / SICGH 158) TaxID=662755 RepID=F8E3K1_CORRG|nr:thioredoxin [Corynebacterium resistens]AEI10527.1 thioredoxin [Corynebacterium resistens DSM 45100]